MELKLSCLPQLTELKLYCFSQLAELKLYCFSQLTEKNLARKTSKPANQQANTTVTQSTRQRLISTPGRGFTSIYTYKIEGSS